MRIEYSKAVAKFISLLDKPTRQRIKAAIEGLTEIPPKGDIKQLQGYDIITCRLRVGKYRVVHRYAEVKGGRILYIIDSGSRGDICK